MEAQAAELTSERKAALGVISELLPRFSEKLGFVVGAKIAVRETVFSPAPIPWGNRQEICFKFGTSCDTRTMAASVTLEMTGRVWTVVGATIGTNGNTESPLPSLIVRFEKDDEDDDGMRTVSWQQAGKYGKRRYLV